MYHGREVEAIRAARDCINSAVNKDADELVTSILYGLIDDLDKAEDEIIYLQAPTKEGRLDKNNRGRFFIQFDDGEEGHDLTCGNALEILNNEEWIIGRVEHNGNAYYFYGPGKPELAIGMRSRIRIQS